MKDEIKFKINDQVVRRWNNRVYYVNHRVCNDEYLVSHKKGSKVKDCICCEHEDNLRLATEDEIVLGYAEEF